jgi:CubicO group peptidase (beta-lactamase class C family)
MKHLPLFFIVFAFACSKPKEEKDLLATSIDSVMNSVVDTARFNGNVLVAKNNKVIYQKSFGSANFYTNALLNDSSLFELASVTKHSQPWAS